MARRSRTTVVMMVVAAVIVVAFALHFGSGDVMQALRSLHGR
jgi:hypothetical protein